MEGRVELVGSDYFQMTSASVAEATDKFQLRPDFGVIAHSLPALSGGQCRFMIAMCQFYSDSEIASICRNTGVDHPSLADLALLEDQHRAVIVPIQAGS